MKNKNSLLPQDLYNANLEEINNIRFTRREIDNIAYLLSGKSFKTIATSLELSPRTVEVHLRNIGNKIGIHSRDGIINFIEQSDKVEILKTYYQSLLIEKAFRNQLKSFSKEISSLSLNPSIYLVCWSELDTKTPFIRSLKDHLSQTNIQVEIEHREIFCPQGEKHKNSLENVTLFYCSETLIKKLGAPEKKERLLQFIQEIKKTSGTYLVIFLHKNFAPEIYEFFEGMKTINFEKDIYYYEGISKILMEIYPRIPFKNKFTEFKQQAQHISQPSSRETYFDTLNSSQFSPLEPQKSSLGSTETPVPKFIDRLLNFLFVKHKRFFLTFLKVMCVNIALYIAVAPMLLTHFQKQEGSLLQEKALRSDLILPDDSVLLNRPHLIEEIDKSLNTSSQGIKTIALVGIGGAGKTILARQYAQQQKASVVAEVDAETKESLSESFENLAAILARTEEDKNSLRKIQNIKFVKEREQQILLFVKNKLNKHSNWFLVYDNVKNFKDIQEYFPRDSGTWGQGKIIVVTRDKNIQTKNFINSMIEVTELTAQEKLDLFVKIMESGTSGDYVPVAREEANSFLKEIPSFPLDVSIAAYYLKSTKISYEKYLEHVKNHHQDFAAVQENVIKEASDYTKTRYEIIILSLDNIIETNSEFSSLLLFISLLNDQNIPIDLLNAYKDDFVVEKFFYHLKRHSLITRVSASPLITSPLLSIHSSVQEMSLSYLHKKLDLKKNQVILDEIVKVMERYVDEVINKEDTLKMQFLEAHLERMASQPLINLRMRERLQGKLSRIYYYLDNYAKAKDLLEKTLDEYRRNNSDDYEKIAETLMYLGNVYSALFDHEEARKLSEESLEIYQKYFPKNPIGTAKALVHLGNIHRRSGNYEKAKELCEKGYEIYKQHYSESSIEMAWVLAHLGLAYKELENYKKAHNLLEKSLKIYQDKKHKNRLREAWVLAHIENIYRKQRNSQKTKYFLERSLTIYKKNFSENHSRTAWVMFLLGEFYLDLKNFDTAETYFKKSLVIYEKNYGKNHTENTKVLTKLGEVYLLKGQVDQGEKFLNRALDISLKSQNPGNYLSLETLADIYLTKSFLALKKGQDKEAELLKHKAIDYLNQAYHAMGENLPKESVQLQKIHKKLRDFQASSKDKNTTKTNNLMLLIQFLKKIYK